mgnify:CR=1 FL=1
MKAFDEDQTDDDQTQEVVQVRALIPSAEEEEVAEVEVLETKNIFISQICKNEKNLTFHLVNINTRF